MRQIDAELLKDKCFAICEEYDTEHLYIDRIIDEIDNAPEIEWIPVTERMPEEYERVLGCLKSRLPVVARIVNGNWIVSWNNAPCPGVTHWMPLPEPPKEE